MVDPGVSRYPDPKHALPPIESVSPLAGANFFPVPRESPRLSFENSSRTPDVSHAAFARLSDAFTPQEMLSLFTSNREQLLIGPACNAGVHHAAEELIASSREECWMVEDLPVEQVRPRLSALLQGVLQARSREAAEILLNDIEADARQFSELIGMKTIGFRFILESGEYVAAVRRTLQSASVEDALEDWSEALLHLGYDGAYVYHRDEHAINQIKCYAGPSTLCLGPDALSRDEGLAMYRRWIDLVLSDTSLSAEITSALKAGDRSGACSLFEKLLVGMTAHQQFLHEPPVSRNPVTPFTLPHGRPCLYFGDQERLDPSGERLLLHARPMPAPDQRAKPRLLTILESPAGQDVRHLFHQEIG